jgi:hypothetical protein
MDQISKGKDEGVFGICDAQQLSADPWIFTKVIKITEQCSEAFRLQLSRIGIGFGMLCIESCLKYHRRFASRRGTRFSRINLSRKGSKVSWKLLRRSIFRSWAAAGLNQRVRLLKGEYFFN